MGKRGKQDWSRQCLPVGTIRVRRERKASGRGWIQVRFIKVKLDPPRWQPLARFTWEQLHGPVPHGKRVVHVDGNTLNDNPANYGLMTAGEVIKLYHRIDPQMSEENHRGEKRRQAIRQHNRDRSYVARATRFLKRWYFVDAQRHVVFDVPFRSRARACARIGMQIPANGSILPMVPYELRRGEELDGTWRRQDLERHVELIARAAVRSETLRFAVWEGGEQRTVSINVDPYPCRAYLATRSCLHEWRQLVAAKRGWDQVCIRCGRKTQSAKVSQLQEAS